MLPPLSRTSFTRRKTFSLRVGLNHPTFSRYTAASSALALIITSISAYWLYERRKYLLCEPLLPVPPHRNVYEHDNTLQSWRNKGGSLRSKCDGINPVKSRCQNLSKLRSSYYDGCSSATRTQSHDTKCGKVQFCDAAATWNNVSSDDTCDGGGGSELLSLPCSHDQGNCPHNCDKSTASPYDLVVIGGGATGCGIALDATARGLRVALIEREDFASGTSSRSTKLIHGGIRYLQKAVLGFDYDQLKLVREALHEREFFMKTAPHLSSWVSIMMPVDEWWKVPYFWLGVKLYDLLAGSSCSAKQSYFLTRNSLSQAFPWLRANDFVGGLVYHDGLHNDARMNVSLAVTAAENGATLVNYVEAIGLLKDDHGKICGVRVRDVLAADGLTASHNDAGADPHHPHHQASQTLGPREFNVAARGVINATGPFTDQIRRMDDSGCKDLMQISSGVHLILPGYFNGNMGNMGLIDPHSSDGRVLFMLPWQGYTVVGTTDTASSLERYPRATHHEVDWILNEVKKYVKPEISISRSDILAAWSGLRPLVRDIRRETTDNDKGKDSFDASCGSNNLAPATENLVRRHVVHWSDSGLLTCCGGKWTTYREMAEQTVDEAMARFGLHDKVSPSTKPLRVVGADGYSDTLYIILAQRTGFNDQVTRHLSHAYGGRAWQIIHLCNEIPGAKDLISQIAHTKLQYLAQIYHSENAHRESLNSGMKLIKRWWTVSPSPAIMPPHQELSSYERRVLEDMIDISQRILLADNQATTPLSQGTNPPGTLVDAGTAWQGTLLAAEVIYAVREEMAQRAIDIIARRSRVAFLDATAAVSALLGAIEIMKSELAWTDHRCEQEWSDGLCFLRSMGLQFKDLSQTA